MTKQEVGMASLRSADLPQRVEAAIRLAASLGPEAYDLIEGRGLAELRRSIARDIASLRARSYPHMCRDGHPEIGFNDSNTESCPVCDVMVGDQPMDWRLRREAREYLRYYGASELDGILRAVGLIQRLLRARGTSAGSAAASAPSLPAVPPSPSSEV